VLGPRADVVRRRFEVPILIAARLVIPVIFIEERATSIVALAVAEWANWLIWAAFTAEFVTLLWAGRTEVGLHPPGLARLAHHRGVVPVPARALRLGPPPPANSAHACPANPPPGPARCDPQPWRSAGSRPGTMASTALLLRPIDYTLRYSVAEHLKWHSGCLGAELPDGMSGTAGLIVVWHS